MKTILIRKPSSDGFVLCKTDEEQTVPSSRGLGRGPLKAATRVRISLGSPIQKRPHLLRSFLYLTISKRDSDEQSSEREVGDDEFKTLASSLVLNEGRGLRRERGPRKAWEFTISLGSPIQAAGIKCLLFLYKSSA